MNPFRYFPAPLAIALLLATGIAIGSALSEFGERSAPNDTRTVEVRIDADLIRYLDAHNCPLPEGAPEPESP